MIFTVRNVRDSYRALRRSSGSTIVSIFCLAIGIGVTVTMFDVVDTLLFRAPPHVRAASEVVWLRLHFHFPGGAQHPQLAGGNVPYDSYLALSDGARMLRGVAAYTMRELSLDRGPESQQVDAAFVTPSFFPLLSVRPVLGRFFLADPDASSAGTPPVILSHWLWRQHFGGDTAVVGRVVRIGNGSYSVVGVAPAGFRGVELKRTGLWLPVRTARDEIFHGDETAFRGTDWLQVIARPKSGVSAERAAAEAAAIWQTSFARRFGASFGAIVAVDPESIIPGRNPSWTREASVSLWLAGIAGIVLIIACANVANLLLIRSLERQREMGVRLALGATRMHLVSQLFVEGLLLCILGGGAALLLCRWGGAVIRAFLLPNIEGIGATVDPRVIGFAVLVSAFTSIGCALAPAVFVGRTDIVASLTGSSAVRGMARSRARSALLMGQITLTTALLAAAGLFVGSLGSLRAVDLGFDPARLLVGRMDLKANGYSESQADALVARMLERVREVPGVERASAARAAPFVDQITWPDFVIPGAQWSGASPTDGRDVLEINAVTPGFFATTGTMVRRGREFSETDRAGTMPVAIINTTMARMFWPSDDPIGKCIKVGKPGSEGDAASAPCSMVVGVVRDTRTANLRREPRLQLYVPLSQGMELGTPTLLVRAERDAPALTATVRKSIQAAGPALPFADVRPLAQYIEPHPRPWRLGATMFGLFGAVALGLSMVGLYAAFAYSVSRREKEIGIRLALGAQPGLVLGLILKEGIRVAAGGLLVGLALAVAVGRALSSLLVAVSWRSPYLLGAIALLVLLTTVLAVYIPARRAVLVDAMAALRTD